MEALGLGLEAIGQALGKWATAFGFIGVTLILVSGALIYFEKISPDDLKKLLKRKDRL